MQVADSKMAFAMKDTPLSKLLGTHVTEWRHAEHGQNKFV